MPNLPSELLKSLSAYGHVDLNAFVEAHREEHKITSVRMNPFKPGPVDLDLGPSVQWATGAFYLRSRPSFTLDPLFQAGSYYVQEAGSMFLEQALTQSLDLSEPLAILDLCAAPGGKSTLIDSLINDQSLLVANEIVRNRAAVLSYNLSKWGTGNTVVTNSDPQKFSQASGCFDAVVIDAPCSGSGLFRKQPEAIQEWSPEHVVQCSVRQKRILTDVLPCLKEGGILFYSTCSYSVEENEDIVKWLKEHADMEYVPLKIDKSWGLAESDAGYRFYPHLTKSEGFFCAVLRKKRAQASAHSKKKRDTDITKADRTLLTPFLKQKEDRHLFKKNNRFHLMNSKALDFLLDFEKQLYFKKAGVLVGELKGKDLVPDHELALSLDLSEQTHRIELDKEKALQFLRKEMFTAHSDRAGLALMRYGGLGIGWAKLLANRINNYLPNELRILNRD